MFGTDDQTVVEWQYCGTTIDDFIRDNLKWLRKAINWAKFSAVAAIGQVHKGSIKHARTVLEPYLPRIGQPMDSPYVEGGGLYALGLIHANRGSLEGSDAVAFILEALQNTRDEVRWPVGRLRCTPPKDYHL